MTTITLETRTEVAPVVELRAWVTKVIADQRFSPVFQPIVDLRTGDVVGYEALTRFDDGRSPDTVFGIARQVGLVVGLEEATAIVALEAARDLPAGWVSINLSAPTLLSSAAVRAAIRWASRPIVVELTEHEPVEDYDALRAAVARLAPSTRLAVDDFGAGHAGMRHLLDLRADIVKLDRWLIEGIVDDPARQALVTGLAAVVRAQGGALLAEGVEHDDQADCLRALGVDLGQGWAFARPLPVASFAA